MVMCMLQAVPSVTSTRWEVRQVIAFQEKLHTLTCNMISTSKFLMCRDPSKIFTLIPFVHLFLMYNVMCSNVAFGSDTTG